MSFTVFGLTCLASVLLFAEPNGHGGRRSVGLQRWEHRLHKFKQRELAAMPVRTTSARVAFHVAFRLLFFSFRSPFLLFGASVLSAFGLQQVTERRRTAGVPDEADLSAAPGQDDGRKRSEAERVLVAGSHKGQRKTGRYHYPRITFQEKKTSTRKILHGASHFLRQCRKQVVQRIQWKILEVNSWQLIVGE